MFCTFCIKLLGRGSSVPLSWALKIHGCGLVFDLQSKVKKIPDRLPHMPIYAYKCDACGHAKDVLQKMSDDTLTDCPACGAPKFVKQLTAPGFQLKGTGWYATDFKGGGAAPAAAAAADAVASPASGGGGAVSAPATSPATSPAASSVTSAGNGAGNGAGVSTGASSGACAASCACH